MPLQSQLFKNDRALEACLTQDSAHVLQGAVGGHVAKIQTALFLLDALIINPGELAASRYGASTAAAVLSFKAKRGIINRNYQSQPDNIVGKMTIAALDKEIFAQEGRAPDAKTCVLFDSLPLDVPGGKGGGASFALTGAGGVSAPASDADIMAAAFKASRRTLRDARDKLFDLANAIRANQSLSPTLTKFFKIAAKWLNLNTSNPQAALPHLDKAILLMMRNSNLKTSAGGDVQLRRVPQTFHALSHLNSPDLGLQCGSTFFSPDGPNCRRDVVTHEFFHMIGVTHGGGSLLGPTIRSAITTPAQALDSADNLAQLVAELETPGGKTDACARPRE